MAAAANCMAERWLAIRRADPLQALAELPQLQAKFRLMRNARILPPELEQVLGSDMLRVGNLTPDLRKQWNIPTMAGAFSSANFVPVIQRLAVQGQSGFNDAFRNMPRFFIDPNRLAVFASDISGSRSELLAIVLLAHELGHARLNMLLDCERGLLKKLIPADYWVEQGAQLSLKAPLFDLLHEYYAARISFQVGLEYVRQFYRQNEFSFPYFSFGTRGSAAIRVSAKTLDAVSKQYAIDGYNISDRRAIAIFESGILDKIAAAAGY